MDHSFNHPIINDQHCNMEEREIEMDNLNGEERWIDRYTQIDALME